MRMTKMASFDARSSRAISLVHLRVSGDCCRWKLLSIMAVFLCSIIKGLYSALMMVPVPVAASLY